MHLLTEDHIMTFLLQVGLLLAAARGLGEVFRRYGQPTISAEILVGVIFGPTLLGRFAPDVHGFVFPADPIQLKMLGTVAWLGILLFLLKAGLETNFAAAWRQRRQALVLSAMDLVVPMAVAIVPAWFLPAAAMGAEGDRLLFSLFVAVIMTISALPVTARVLQELKIYRTDLGLLIMSALTINDVAGWVVFALILGTVTEAGMSVGHMSLVLGSTVAFAVVCLAWGTRLFDGALGFLARRRVPQPAGELTLVFVTGMLGGAVTAAIGIHALFGFFIAGIMAGGAARLSEHSRHVFDQLVTALLVPLFFTAVGLKLDFAGNFDPLLVGILLVVGIAGRWLAAYLGARLAGQPSLHGRLIADAHVPGGEMQIIIGMLALEYGVISESLYVAIVFGAIVTSVMAGPLMGRTLARVETADWLAFLPVDHILPRLEAADRDEAVARLCARAAGDAGRDPGELAAAVLERERGQSTALGDQVAAPHGRIPGLARPVVVVARCPDGLPWNSSDGEPVRLIFLMLTPAADPGAHLRILRCLSRALTIPGLRDRLLAAEDAPALLETLRLAQRAPAIPSPV